MSKLDILAQQVEQAEAAVSAMANLTSIYFHGLLDNHVIYGDALELTKVFVSSFVQAQKPPPGNKPEDK